MFHPISWHLVLILHFVVLFKFLFLHTRNKIIIKSFIYFDQLLTIRFSVIDLFAMDFHFIRYFFLFFRILYRLQMFLIFPLSTKTGYDECFVMMNDSGLSECANMWFLIRFLATIDSSSILVLSMDFFILNPLSTEACPWPRVRTSLATLTRFLNKFEEKVTKTSFWSVKS